MSISTLNRARYAGQDFDTHGDDLRSHLQVQLAADFNDFAISSLGIMLLDLTAYGLDTLSFYVDRRATDLYLTTARTRKSITKAARQLGYAPGGAVSSGVEVEVAIAVAVGFNVTLPAGWQFQGPNNLVFETAREVEFTAGAGPTDVISIPCFEGQTFVESFVSDGTSKQVYGLRRVPSESFAVQGTVVVLVDGVSWDFSKLLAYGDTTQFEVGFVEDPAEVRFGDGIAGGIPAVGATIQVTYVAARGRAGQVTAGTITGSVKNLVVEFETVPLTVTNPEASSGGDDAESLASIKAYAPQVWRSRDVAVTGSDYAALSGSYADPLFGRVAVAKAISSRGASDDVTLQNLLAQLSDTIALFDPVVQTQTSSIAASVLTGQASNTATGDAVTAADAEFDTIAIDSSAIRTTAQDIKTAGGEIAVDVSDIQALVVAGNAAVDAVGPGGTADIDAGQADGIKEHFNRINAEASQIQSTVGASVIDLANTIVSSAADIDTAVAAGKAEIVTSHTGMLSIGVAFVSIDDANALILAANTDVVSEVSTISTGIYDHMDALLSNSCKANLVTVPILTRNAAGFYSAPSTGLVASLQTFLDARKEVTQTISVTSGAIFLLPAIIEVRVGVLRTFSEAAVKTAVGTAIDGVLRDRDFSEDLYESDLEDAILAVAGVVFTNTSIGGYDDGGTTNTTKLDGDGNLIAATSEVVTRGTVTVTTEIFTG